MLPTLLPFKELTGKWPEYFNRVIFYDPALIYSRLDKHLNHFKRVQDGSLTDVAFPRLENLCSCGCGTVIKSNKIRKYATPICSAFAYRIYGTVMGFAGQYTPLIFAYHGKVCIDCGSPDRKSSALQIDHKLPVKHGGGACWLDNLVPRCNDCHRDKTKRDFGWGQYKPDLTNQIAISFDFQ